jgi:hypothetical protein
MLFGQSGAKKPLAVVDWQTAGKGAPANDVAYFIGAGLTREDRPKHEQALLRHYHDCLKAEGITSYSFDDLYTHYRWFAFYGVSVAFAAAMIPDQLVGGLLAQGGGMQAGTKQFGRQGRRQILIDQKANHEARATVLCTSLKRRA